MTVGYILVGILGLALLMIIHEAGHFWAARAFGMRVLRFSIGFGPTLARIEPDAGHYWLATAGGRLRMRLWRHVPEKHGPTVFQVAAIPFLAYVQVAGMNPLEEIDPEDRGSYANASLFGRVVTILGGPAANYLFASVFFFFAFLLGGVVPDQPSTAVEVFPDKPAAAALRDGDRIVSVAGRDVERWTDMARSISERPGLPTPLVVEREGRRFEVSITPLTVAGEDDKGNKITRGIIGVRPKRFPVSAAEAAERSVVAPAEVVREVVLGLGRLVAGLTRVEVHGPVKIVEETAMAAHLGFNDLFEWLGRLSAYLAAFNMIPFPALDGGRLMFLGYEAATRRRANPRVEGIVHAAGLLMMLGLLSYVTVFNDLAGK